MLPGLENPTMATDSLKPHELAPETAEFYRHATRALLNTGIPFLVGGAYALKHYAGIVRSTKDFDLFVYGKDRDRVLQVLSAAGYETGITFPHWIGKATWGGDYIDIIHGSGNGLCTVDAEWFAHAPTAQVLDLQLPLIPPEEMIWQKAFILTRERCDSADILHVLRARGATLDWPRLLKRFGAQWQVLFSQLILYQFVYPHAEQQPPQWVLQELIRRYQVESLASTSDPALCRGPLLSVRDYLPDLEEWGYRDARLVPEGAMTADQIRIWTEAFR